MNKKIDQKWAEAEKTGKPISIENIVICDICDKDYTDLPDNGGFIFTSSACCPDCAEKVLKTIKFHNAERFIKTTCPENVSFADFVNQYRGNGNYIQINKR